MSRSFIDFASDVMSDRNAASCGPGIREIAESAAALIKTDLCIRVTGGPQLIEQRQTILAGREKAGAVDEGRRGAQRILAECFLGAKEHNVNILQVAVFLISGANRRGVARAGRPGRRGSSALRRTIRR